MTIRPGHTVLNTLDSTTHTVARLRIEEILGLGEILLIETTNRRRLLSGSCINVTALALRLTAGTAVRHTTTGDVGTITKAPYVTGGHVAAQVEWESGKSGTYDVGYLEPEIWWQVFVTHPDQTTEATIVLAWDEEDAHATAADNWPHADIVAEPVTERVDH